MTVRLIAATALAFGAVAAPAAAAAIEPLEPCYVAAGAGEDEREIMSVRATGFAPYVELEVLVDGVRAIAGTTDSVGELTANVPAPHVAAGERAVQVVAREAANPAVASTATTRVTALTAELRPREAPPRRRVRLIARGFTADAPVYAHYSYAGRVRRTVRLGRPEGECGTLDVRRRQIPVRRPRVGEWRLQIDQKRAFSLDPGTNWVRLVISVAPRAPRS